MVSLLVLRYGRGMHICCNGEKISISIVVRLPEQRARHRRNMQPSAELSMNCFYLAEESFSQAVYPNCHKAGSYTV